MRAISLLIVLALSLVVNGQRQESFEGFITGVRANAVKGEVAYQRGDGKFDLEPGLKLQEDDFIKSSADSYAELLLQPGNYLRVGGATECQIVSDQHDKMRFKLDHGTISLEILSNEWDGSPGFSHSINQAYELIRVITPAAEVFITQPGIFRINALGGERTELIVRDGEAVINGQRVKKKRKAVASADTVTIAEIDSKLEDSFDLWGRERADKSVNANRLLKNQSPWADKRNEDQETSVEVPDDEEQSSSPFVVSARPGAVTFVESGVEINRPTKEWQELTEKSELNTGDKLRTSEHSFVELTILPDMYLRLNGKSELLFEQLSNESISLKLLRGSAILDVARFESKEVPPITLSGPSTSAVIAHEGNYRINVRPSGDEITVRDGKVIFNGRSVGACHTIARGTVSDCDKKRSDNFDFWSEHRGEGEFFSGRITVGMASHLARLRRMRFKNTGFWFQNPGQTDYTFVPFTSTRFRSPYGGNYSTVLAPRRIPMNRVDMGGRPSFRFPRPQVERPQF